MDNGKADPKTPEDLAKAIFHNTDRKLHAFAYAIEACYKYNIRKLSDPFNSFLNAAVTP